jgi:GT2 family glycosyltransferase
MMVSQFPHVSIVIVNYNAKDALLQCINSIHEMIYPKNKLEIIVVDNDSSDDSCNAVKRAYPKVKLVQNKKNLGYVGINSALPSCKGEYIYFINNDVTLNKECLNNLVKTIESDPSIALASHTLINYYNRKLVSGGTWASRAMYSGHFKKTGKSKIVEIPYMGGGLIRKSVVKKLGYLFDPDYFIYAEDFDLGLTIRLLGMKTVQIPGAVNYHMHALAMKKYSTSCRNTFLLERNLLTTFLKIFSLKSIFILLPYVIIFRILTIAKDVLSLRIKNAFSRICSIVWIVLHLPGIISKRNKLQNIRKAGDNYILEIFTEKHLFKKPFIV